ncbi:MAG: phage holin family protein [Armatimonadota bacterium]|nr:phage holin family protein [Armatimonadota bacterium]
MRLLIYWVISAIALILSAFVAQAIGFDISLDFDPPWKIMVGTLVLGLVNATIGLFLKFITTPLNCLTFGFAWLIVNAALFYMVGQIGTRASSPMGFYIGDFWAALAGSVMMGFALGLLRQLTDDKNDRPT